MDAQTERTEAVLDAPCDCNLFPWISFVSSAHPPRM